LSGVDLTLGVGSKIDVAQWDARAVKEHLSGERLASASVESTAFADVLVEATRSLPEVGMLGLECGPATPLDQPPCPFALSSRR
jgi:hypothetical protein